MAEWSDKAERAAHLAPSWVWDLVGMVLLAMLGIFLEFQAPFERYLVAENLPRYSYPYVANPSVPDWMLPVLGIFLPLGVILVVTRLSHRSGGGGGGGGSTGYTMDVQSGGVGGGGGGGSGLEARRASAGLCLSVALAFAITNGVKNGVGAFRPDFSSRCWPDGKIEWTSPGVPACHPARARDVLQGRKSFPSGHTSMAFAGMGYITIYLTARLRVFPSQPDPNEASVWRMAVSWAPAVLATFVGISRTQDYWHHWEDVCVGALIGLSTSALAFVQKKPLHGHYYGRRRAGGAGGGQYEYAPLRDRDRIVTGDDDHLLRGGDMLKERRGVGGGQTEERGDYDSDSPAMSEAIAGGGSGSGGGGGGGGGGRGGGGSNMGSLGVRERSTSVAHEMANMG